MIKTIRKIVLCSCDENYSKPPSRPPLPLTVWLFSAFWYFSRLSFCSWSPATVFFSIPLAPFLLPLAKAISGDTPLTLIRSPCAFIIILIVLNYLICIHFVSITCCRELAMSTSAKHNAIVENEFILSLGVNCFQPIIIVVLFWLCQTAILHSRIGWASAYIRNISTSQQPCARL